MKIKYRGPKDPHLNKYCCHLWSFQLIKSLTPTTTTQCQIYEAVLPSEKIWVYPKNRAYTIRCTSLYLVNNFNLTLNLLVLLLQLPSCKCSIRYFYLVQDYASMSNYNLIKVINVYALGKHSVICRHLSFSCLPILVVIYALLSTSKHPQVTTLATLKLRHPVAYGTVFSACI